MRGGELGAGRRAHFRPPSGGRWRPSARRSTGSSPRISPTRSAPFSPARIAGVTRVGLFVKLRDTGADGFIPAATLGDDYFRFEEASRALVGTRSGNAFRLGDARPRAARRGRAVRGRAAIRDRCRRRGGSPARGRGGPEPSRAAAASPPQAQPQTGRRARGDERHVRHSAASAAGRAGPFARARRSSAASWALPGLRAGPAVPLLSQARNDLQGLRRGPEPRPRRRRAGLSDAADRLPRRRRAGVLCRTNLARLAAAESRLLWLSVAVAVEPPAPAADQGRGGRPAMGARACTGSGGRERRRDRGRGRPGQRRCARATRRRSSSSIAPGPEPQGADGQAARGARLHARQVRLSRRPGRAGGPAHGRRRRARPARRGEAQRPRAAPLARLRPRDCARRDPRDLRGDGARDRRRPTTARRKIRRRAPGRGSRRPASIRRSTTSTSSPARSRRRDARAASTPAFSSSTPSAIARRVEGVVHPERGAWSSLSGRRSTRRASSTCRMITHMALDDLARRLKAASTAAGRGRSIASCAASGCARSL